MSLHGLVCVARKDLSEWLSDRESRRGFVVQASILLAMMGIFVPWTTPALWGSPGGVVIVYVVFPSLIASMLSADAFAGEKERHTLESLLATPLTDAELFAGKVTAAVGLSTLVSLSAVLAGVFTLSLKARHAPAILPSVPHCLSVMAGSFGAALIISALAVAVSSRVSVARSAQQLVQVVFLLFTGLISFLLNRFMGELTWHTAALGCSVLILIGLACVALASSLFSRERLIAEL